MIHFWSIHFHKTHNRERGCLCSLFCCRGDDTTVRQRDVASGPPLDSFDLNQPFLQRRVRRSSVTLHPYPATWRCIRYAFGQLCLKSTVSATAGQKSCHPERKRKISCFSYRRWLKRYEILRSAPSSPRPQNDSFFYNFISIEKTCCNINNIMLY